VANMRYTKDDDDEEEGEVSEEGEVLEENQERAQSYPEMKTNIQALPVLQRPPQSNSISNFAESLFNAMERVQSENESILPTPTNNSVNNLKQPIRYSVKRIHSPAKSPESKRARTASTNYSNVPQNQYQYQNSNRTTVNPYSNSQRKEKRRDAYSMAEKRHEISNVLLQPIQNIESRVLLNFNFWVDQCWQNITTLYTSDLQNIILNVLDDNETNISKYLENPLWPGKYPTKVCMVILKGLHPDTCARRRKDLEFFNSCSSLPCTLFKTSQAKMKETPLSQLLYQFPMPSANLK